MDVNTGLKTGEEPYDMLDHCNCKVKDSCVDNGHICQTA